MAVAIVLGFEMVDAGSQRALAALQALQAQPGRRVWMCGSCAEAGVPLLKSEVRSAYEVAGRLAGLAAGSVAARVPATST